MPLVWLRAALVLYGVGLLYSMVALGRRSQLIEKITGPAIQLGLVLHFVSLVESTRLAGQLSPAGLQDLASLLGFLFMLGFVTVYRLYRTLSPGILVFPPVFLLTFAAAWAKQPLEFNSPLVRSSWIFLHITLIFAGYVALLLSFACSILYLVQERGLKSKSGSLVSRLPSLAVIDQIGYRSLLLGFPFMTLGLATGAAIAEWRFGARFFWDPKVLLSVLMWLVYICLLYTRWNTGWRGRRAAWLSSAVFLAAIGAWAANYVSNMHRFMP